MSPSRPLFALAVAGLLLVPAARAADLPRQMTFQGRLVRADGSPETSPQALRFALYATASGGAPLWEESHPSVPVTHGYYAVVLGASLPLPASVLTGQALYLGVSLVGQSELTPRLPVVAVPYALRADDSNRLEGRTASAFADSGHTHPAATPTAPGLMAAADKTKLNAQPNSFGPSLVLSAGVLNVAFPSGGNHGSASTAARSNHSHPLSCTYRTATGNTDGGKGATSWCGAGEVLTGGGCSELGGTGGGDGGTDSGLFSGPTNVSTQDGSTPTSGPAWLCRASTGTSTPTAYAICCRNLAP